MYEEEPGQEMPQRGQVSRKISDKGNSAKFPASALPWQNQRWLLSGLLSSQQNEVFPYIRLHTLLLALKALQACPIIKASTNACHSHEFGHSPESWGCRNRTEISHS
jgi:hypothetical protein